MNDYQKTIAVNKPVNEVYTALTEDIAGWWSNDLSGAAAHVGDSFNIAFGKTKKTFNIVEAIPGERVVWECVKAYINNATLENKSEWVGTKMIWTLSGTEKNTVIHFLHEGLNKNLQCYDLCEAGWDMFLSSLETYLTTGKGSPYLKPAVNV